MSVKSKDRFYRDSRDDDKRYMGPMLRFEEPKYLNSRIIVSNIDDRVIRETLEDKFTRYGRILGVSMHRNFAYVQFENDVSAISAIKSENESIFSGNKIDVRLAKFSRKEEKPKFLPVQAGRRRVSPPRRESNALRDNYRSSSYRDRSPSREDSYRKDGFRSRSRTPPRRDMDDRSDRSVPENREVSKTNNCEIIVFDKSQRVYAEIVEWKLKSMGMQVDILFPKPDSPLVDILEDIGNRGSLYAIVISPQNAIHRSVTVNILHGDLQEHRNMPMDGAMELISKNFENYKIEASRTKNTTQDLTRSEIQQLLRELAEGKQIPLLQLDKVIHHLQDYREFLLSTESEKQNPNLNRSQGPPNIPTQPQIQSSSSTPSESELRRKLLDLLGGNGSQQQQQQQQMNQNRTKPTQFSDARYEDNYSNSSSSLDRNRGFDQQAQSQFNPNSLPESSNKLSPGINLENPEVKRALDALMQGSGAKILQNIEASANVVGSGMTAARASANLGNAGRANMLVGAGNMGPGGGNLGSVGSSGESMIGRGGNMIGGGGNMGGVGGLNVASGSGYLPPQQQKPPQQQQQQHQQFYGGQPTPYNYGMGPGSGLAGPRPNNYNNPGMGLPSLLGMQNVRQPMQQQQQQPNPYNNRPFY